MDEEANYGAPSRRLHYKQNVEKREAFILRRTQSLRANASFEVDAC